MPLCRRCGRVRCREAGAGAARSLLLSLMVVVLAAAGILPLVVWTADLTPPRSTVRTAGREVPLAAGRSHPATRQPAAKTAGAAARRNTEPHHLTYVGQPPGADAGSATTVVIPMRGLSAVSRTQRRLARSQWPPQTCAVSWRRWPPRNADRASSTWGHAETVQAVRTSWHTDAGGAYRTSSILPAARPDTR